MSDDVKTAEQMAEEIKSNFQKSHDAVKEIAEKALAEAGSGTKMAESFKEKADEALIKMNGLQEQIAEIDQRLARSGDGKPEAHKSLGERFVETDKVKAWLDSAPTSGKADMRVKASLTSAITDTDGAVGDAIAPTRRPGVLMLPDRKLTIRDLIAPGRMDGNTIEYVKETGFNNNAAMVAEEGLKPQSDIKYDLVQTGAKVIAHHFKASRQVLDDIPQLRSHIDARLLYGLALKEETQILNGDGTGQNLLGIIPQATAYSASFVPDAESAIDKMRLAQLQAALAEYPATGHVLNPIDWARIELTKDSEGRYIIGQPQGAIAASLWKLPVVETQSIAADKFLTGSFNLAAQFFDRWDARVEVGYVDDDFTTNRVTILGEERGALAVYRPEAFIYGDLGYSV